MGNELSKVYYENDEAKKKALQEKFATETLPNSFKPIEAKLAGNSSGFLVGDALTWVDLYLVIFAEWFAFNDKKDLFFANFPKIKAHDEKIRALPKLAEWIAKRPVTAF